MNAKVQHNNILDRNDIISYIREKILENTNKEYEISATDLAKHFGVQGPTMDYHLKKFLDEGLFLVSDKKGKYGRKIFVLPEQDKPAIVDNMSAFKGLLQEKLDAGDIQLNLDKIDKEVEEEKRKEEDEKLKAAADLIINTGVSSIVGNTGIIDYGTDTKDHIEDTDNSFPPSYYDVGNAMVKQKPIEVTELSLNDKIEQFLIQSKNVPSASDLISKTDKEVLSVMSESIQQQMVYLKDLSNQLELMENLALLHNLIDERNKMMEEMEQIRTEHSQLLKTLSNNENQVSVDPQRVRLMHQIIINTIDNFIELPNHSLALQRREFRNAVSKEVSDLANYIIGIEK